MHRLIGAKPERPLAAVVSAALLVSVPACSGHEGTIGVSVVASPDSDLLGRIDRLQATFPALNTQVSAERDSNGSLDLAIDVEADGRSGDLIIEGFDSMGDRIAVGRVGPLPLAAIDAEVVAFLAPGLSVTQAPVSLTTARSDIGGTEASFGALLAGGLGEAGPVGDVDVYSTYLHDMQSGLALPSPRSELSVTAGSVGFIYIIGGTNEEGEPQSESYAFDTRVPPTGSHRPLVIGDDFARSGSTTAIVGQEQFLVNGDPALLLDGLLGVLRPLPDGESLDGPAATAIAENRLQVVFGGAGVVDPVLGGVGAAIFELNQVTHIPAPPELVRTGHRALTLLTQEVLFVGGALEGQAATTTAVRYSASTGGFTVLDLLATGRRNPAVALTNRYLLVIGGEDDMGEAIGTAEIFDALTLEPVETIPLVVARKGVTAHALGNGQVLIAGGIDGQGRPTELLGLFTPDESTSN
ncbi:MAG: hypothetical protein GY811_29210 [Myxococcales bacterium]|nr:hypothetical protein [Myxococcales bacterium]